MFDPTIFDNLKVSIENYVYDLDNLAEEVTVTNREDLMEMATMSRSFVLQFVLADSPEVKAEIVLDASLKDLATEILEVKGEDPGCQLTVRFYKEIDSVEEQCAQIQEALDEIWDQGQPPVQTLSYVYGQNEMMNKIEIKFNRKINEDQIEDIPNLVDHVIDSLDRLDEI
ncbi:hypothetical protein ACSVDE_17125 [Pseudalkalibacillus sp. Hm43]|uniref:hypothetical protein n=1 Tax=Pseudalkalibacillus sp. Hm43 TaxID=3450742 RepID=UPI003F42F0B5